MQLRLSLDSTVVVGAIIFCRNDCCSLSHHDAMRTGSAVIVQRGDFVVAGDCGPFENLVRCGFPNELFAGEPKNLTHVGIGFSA